ncbi:MAG: carbohydrate-binding family 9-like protein [Daejeonella sp.]|uniref:carbohydrate-binding family 9-like protein n=1 Tax=Daejeonella sp. TaxID=2805397 RepID=UPI002733F0A4|nr:carbohydrate-binding family 9-like protein [Daejeonella sp.]MDP3466847.1 carbohydrate-binding family 9-like protein [Daejeonella sp.]
MPIKIFYPQKVFYLLFTFLLTFLIISPGSAQPKFTGKADLLSTPKKYTVFFNAESPKIDGKLDDEAWRNVEWTDNFQDIEADRKPRPIWNTRAKMTWDSKGLYIAAELLEPHVWAYLKNYDDIVFYDNDFEVFIDPDNDTHRYYEFEVNALNTMFDLFMPKPYRNGSGALIAYNAPGMQWAVEIQGTLNNPSDIDKGWTVEMFIPFGAVTMGNSPKIPADGDFWRINFSRVQWKTEVVDGKYVKLKGADGRNLPEYNWVWSPQGVINMHFPERWAYLQFSNKPSGSSKNSFTIPYSEEQKKYLWYVYYLQQDYYQKHKVYASDLGKLGISEPIFLVGGKENKLWMEAGTHQFMVFISSDDLVYSVNNEGLVQLRNRTSK